MYLNMPLSLSSSSLSAKPLLSPPRTDVSSLAFFKSFQKISRRKLVVQAAGNTYGTYFRVTTYGSAVGFVISGCPPGIPLSEADMQVDLDRRKSGRSRIATHQKEIDTCRIYSGVVDGVTTGTPILVSVPNIRVTVPNTYRRGHSYSEMVKAYRPSQADATYDFKYGVRFLEGYSGMVKAYRPSQAHATYDFKYGVRFLEGGGRSSASETFTRVAAGAVAKKILKFYFGTEVLAYVSQVHNVVLPDGVIDHETLTLEQIESTMVRCPNPEYAEKMISAIEAARVQEKSIGGVVTCIARTVPQGVVSPVCSQLEAELGKAVLSLPATMGFECGSLFVGSFMTGGTHNDEFYVSKNGIQGGLSNGETLTMRVAFSLTPTITKQRAITRDNQEIDLITPDLHHACAVPQAVPIVEAMVALVLVDQLMARSAHGSVSSLTSL